jgi:hypothetical protein
LVNDPFTEFVATRGKTAEVVVTPIGGPSIVRVFTGCWGLGGKREAKFAGDWASEHGTSEDGAAKDGITEDGVSEDGITKDGVSGDGISKDGASKDGNAKEWFIRDGTAEGRTVEAVVVDDPTTAVGATIVVNVPRSCNVGGIGVGIAGAGWNGRDKGKLSDASSTGCDRLGTQASDQELVDKLVPLMEGWWSWWECPDWPSDRKSFISLTGKV